MSVAMSREVVILVIRSYLESYKMQLKTIPKIGSYGGKSYRWVEINAKKELCEKLIGQR